MDQYGGGGGEMPGSMRGGAFLPQMMRHPGGMRPLPPGGQQTLYSGGMSYPSGAQQQHQQQQMLEGGHYPLMQQQQGGVYMDMRQAAVFKQKLSIKSVTF